MKETQVHQLGVIVNGVTGRMGTNQHLIRSIVGVRQQGGVRCADGDTIMPEPLLMGRNAAKLKALSAAHGGLKWTTDLDAALADAANQVYFDSLTTSLRVPNVKKAIAAGKHIYCEKPIATTLADAYGLYRLAKKAGIRHGVVQDKLWLPGFLKLKMLVDTGYFGRIVAVRGEFGYWVFEGDQAPCQRPSWNYRSKEGSIIIDMFCHWRYVLDNILGPVKAVSATAATHIPKRWDEAGKPYACAADDAAYAHFELEGGIPVAFNSSWCVRVRRDDLLVIQVDGTKGSAVAGLRDCWIQPASATPRPVWNPDIENPINFYDGWTKLPNQRVYDNAFKVQWELYLRHVVKGDPFKWNLLEGAKGVQLAEKGAESWKKRKWVDVPDLKA